MMLQRRPPKRERLPRRPAAGTGEQMTGPQMIAYNAGRKLYRRCLIDALGNGWMPDVSDLWLTRRERMCLKVMGDAEFRHWMRQGAIRQAVRNLRTVRGG